MKKVLSVQTHYIDTETGKKTSENVIRDVTKDCLATDAPETGVRSGTTFLYADGSRIDAHGHLSMPAPLGGQYPRQRYSLIFKYWEVLYEQKQNEFDKLKAILERRGESFEIRKNGTSIDAFERLRQLPKEIKKAAAGFRKAQEVFETAGDPTYRETEADRLHASRKASREAAFSREVSKIEVDESANVKKTPRASMR